MTAADTAREAELRDYSYSQSQMQPPFWIVKEGQRHLCEVWSEADAQMIVSALSRLRAVPDTSDLEIAMAAWRSISWGTQMAWSQTEVDKVITAFVIELAVVRAEVRRATVEQTWADAIAFIEGGHFLHDNAPPKLFATECAKAMRHRGPTKRSLSPTAKE